MSDDAIQPALTAEEWAGATKSLHGGGTYIEHALDPGLAIDLWPDGELCVSDRGDSHDSVYFGIKRRHALAALALHGQPFGFTHEDLADLRVVCDAYDWDSIHGEESDRQDRLPQILAKIAALLPPQP